MIGTPNAFAMFTDNNTGSVVVSFAAGGTWLTLCETDKGRVVELFLTPRDLDRLIEYLAAAKVEAEK